MFTDQFYRGKLLCNNKNIIINNWSFKYELGINLNKDLSELESSVFNKEKYEIRLVYLINVRYKF